MHGQDGVLGDGDGDGDAGERPRGEGGEEAAIAAPQRTPSLAQLLDWCSALCDVQVGLLACAAQRGARRVDERERGEGEGEEMRKREGTDGNGAAAWAASASSMRLSLSLLSAVSALLAGHFAPVSRRSRQLAATLKAAGAVGVGEAWRARDAAAMSKAMHTLLADRTRPSTAAFAYRIERVRM